MTERHTPSPMRSPLGRAIGLGSAKDGVEHWWVLRLTSLALIPLTIWFVVAVIELAGAERATFLAWLRHPVQAVVMLLLVIATFYHTALGLQVVIEDYVHNEAAKFGAIIVMRFACFVLAVLGLVAVLKLALGA